MSTTTTRRPTIAGEEILLRHGAEMMSTTTTTTDHREEQGERQRQCEGIRYKGWEFFSLHSTILDETELIDMARRISNFCGAEPRADDDKIALNGTLLHLPPMTFANDVLRALHIGSGYSLSFDATDALAAWAAGHLKERELELERLDPSISIHLSDSRRIIKVPFSRQWAEKSIPDVEVSSVSVSASDSDGGELEDSSSVTATRETAPSSSSGLLKGHWEWDWTFSSDYCFTLLASPSSADSTDQLSHSPPSSEHKTKSIFTAPWLSASTNSNSNDNTLDTDASSSSSTDVYTFRRLSEEIGETGIDRELLKRREDILFYDEMLLYQDDLEDCGEVSFDVKLRVMPSCWYVLSRLFVRVDGSETRIRSTRVFHRFEEDGQRAKVAIEVNWQRATSEEINRMYTARSAGRIQSSSRWAAAGNEGVGQIARGEDTYINKSQSQPQMNLPMTAMNTTNTPRPISAMNRNLTAMSSASISSISISGPATNQIKSPSRSSGTLNHYGDYHGHSLRSDETTTAPSSLIRDPNAMSELLPSANTELGLHDKFVLLL